MTDTSPLPPPPVPDSPDDWALFLDIDGTLLEIAPTPDSVVVPPTLVATLRTLAIALDGALAVISGRPIAEIDHLLPGNFDAAGTHGAEWRLDGRSLEADRASEHAIAAAMPMIAEAAGALPGVLVERKAVAVALHYRAAPARAEDVTRLARRVLEEIGPGFRLLEGRNVVEIVPAGADKGSGIRRFMAHRPYAGRRPIFAGDDVTDESGLAAVALSEGLAIGVGARRSEAARHHLPGPAAVLDWLTAFARRVA